MRYNFKYNVYNAHIVKEKSFGLFAPGEALKVLGWNMMKYTFSGTDNTEENRENSSFVSNAFF